VKSEKKMKTKAVWIRRILVGLFCVCAANASVIMRLDQVGPNVVATGSGTVNLAGLSLDEQTFNFRLGVQPIATWLVVGAPGHGDGGGVLIVSYFYHSVSGPLSFGSGSFTNVSTSSGDAISSGDAMGVINCTDRRHSPPCGFTTVTPFFGIIVPLFYVSSTPLSGTATWDNTTIAGLGATPGIYTWTWGSGPNADSLTLLIGIPEPAPALLLTLGAAALVLLTRRCSTRNRNPDQV
jgi:hypothetical protein